MKGPYDFYTLVTCLIILALQIHNPFQSREQSSCHCDGSTAALRSADAAAQQGRPAAGVNSRGAQEHAQAMPMSRRPREAAAAAASAQGLSTDALLRELDSIQGRAKEQQDVLAAAGRMPPPSPILQQLKESEAGMQAQARPPPMPQSAPPRAQAAPMAPSAGVVPAAAEGALVRRRDDLGRFLQAQMPRGLGVVLGVGRGDFALRLLRDWSSAQGLYLVDPFIQQWRGYDDPANLPDAEQQMIFEELRNRLEPFEGRYVLVRDFSHSFAEVYKRGEQSPNVATFIYIDANHAEEAVARDLELWWPILAPGGLLAGSTYADDAAGRVRVRSAVDKFAARRNLQVTATQDDMQPSWFIVKP